MTNAQKGGTLTARSNLTLGLRGAEATRFAGRLWCQATGMVMSHAIAPVVGWLRVNREIAELRRMDARELRDIGVNRSDVLAIREGTRRHSAALSAERIVFNPESIQEQDADAESKPMDFFAPFAPDQNWYMKWWLGD